MVQQFQLTGHQGPVTCLAHSSNAQQGVKTTKIKKKQHANNTKLPCCLLSGSEDGTVRLWDFRSNPSRASLCILSPNKQEEITSVAFHPTFDDDETENAYPFTVFASIGSAVYGQASSPILQLHHYQLQTLEGEEINQIALTTAQTNKRIYMASADDDGFARVTDSIPNRFNANSNSSSSASASNAAAGNRCTLLQHCEDTSLASSSAALVTSLAFRPKAKYLDLATGGTDCIVCLWDVNRPRRPSATFVIQREEEEGVNQVCNPPFVNSLSWSPSGRLLAAGLGDGSAMVMQVDGRRLVDGCRLRGGHDAAIASVLFPRFGGLDSSHVVADDRLLVTGGNDGSIILWDLGGNLVKDGIDPSTVFVDCNGNCDGDGDGNGDTSIADLDHVDGAMKDLSLRDANSANGKDPRILMGLHHGKKPNCIESCNALDPVFPSSLFVADISNAITVYTFPRGP